ncbi:hypothetical protein P2W68_05780 [Chryseobacterium arthrosphaerae]|uniref:hypothetical protein n=1 Tax=Chryseobacterium arthrosphaerae TaxID=651561 RepID=UPI0023E2C390|nr:hypothetical protein [Chryseobacterium arthrosphaerae]WES99125.1 hypothetical protein P2W68_05780 [Chryseobacterium arthrosphaerae]
MKGATLLAVISLSIIILVDLIQLILGFTETYSMELYTAFGVINLLCFVGILQFFIKLYNKQKE